MRKKTHPEVRSILGRWLLAFSLATFFFLIGLPYLVVQVRAPMATNPERTPASFMPVSVYLPKEKRITQLPLEDYVKGVVAAEMPASFPSEALKAQAMVARTYLVAHMPAFGGEGCDITQVNEVEGLSPRAQVIDICADPQQGQAWLSADQLRERWGMIGYLRYWAKISRAVEETRGKIIVYRGAPIDAVYHAASGGLTEDARHVWGNDIAYLQGVDSAVEEGSRYWRNSQSFEPVELAAKLDRSAEILQEQIRRGELPVEVTQKSPSGRALEIRVGQEKISGQEFRERLALPSTWIEFQFDRRKIEIVTRGYGHGVGMSQYGAEGMARQGHSAEEIIQHYYSGVQLREIFAE